MPTKYSDSGSSTMEIQMTPKHKMTFGINGNHEGPGGHTLPRSDAFDHDDNSFQFLSHEEKECLMFFETTIDSFDHDDEAEIVQLSTSSLDEADTAGLPHTQSIEEQEDIIDLVQKNQINLESKPFVSNSPFSKDDTGSSWVEEINAKPPMTKTLSSSSCSPLPSPRSEEDGDVQKVQRQNSFSNFHPIGSVPTPVIVAQKIARTQSVNRESPSSSKFDERKRSLDNKFLFLSGKHSDNPDHKLLKLPGNINLNACPKKVIDTIARAAVNVPERRAQVLANLHDTMFTPLNEDESLENILRRNISFKGSTPNLSRPEDCLIESEHISKVSSSQTDISTNETVTDAYPHRETEPKATSANRLWKSVSFKPVGSSPENGNVRSFATKSFHERKADTPSSEVRRSSSRPSGFRPLGITVQFSGRDSEESRKEALRKLGLVRSSS
ncbi:proline and serine-rich protein 2-like [Erpetoichthys calabaricus]|uniref:Proline and serine rich 2 n=1 Tax=Erpetoichthys calabaricus TaxID=27687 RepID=A0A8C4SCF9_ERPCA|nr:proline and serine-rich protein 2-like [Erpetoichthys calabaricus]